MFLHHQARGLTQPAHAAEAWRAGILPPVGRRGAASAAAAPAAEGDVNPLSEKMVVYMTTRRKRRRGSRAARLACAGRGLTGARLGWYPQTRAPRLITSVSSSFLFRRYSLDEELTVDYGASYSRNYPSGKHRASGGAPLYAIPRDSVGAAALRAARFPSLPGWWNPHRSASRKRLPPPPLSTSQSKSSGQSMGNEFHCNATRRSQTC